MVKKLAVLLLSRRIPQQSHDIATPLFLSMLQCRTSFVVKDIHIGSACKKRLHNFSAPLFCSLHQSRLSVFIRSIYICPGFQQKFYHVGSAIICRNHQRGLPIIICSIYICSGGKQCLYHSNTAVLHSFHQQRFTVIVIRTWADPIPQCLLQLHHGAGAHCTLAYPIGAFTLPHCYSRHRNSSQQTYHYISFHCLYYSLLRRF